MKTAFDTGLFPFVLRAVLSSRASLLLRSPTFLLARCGLLLALLLTFTGPLAAAPATHNDPRDTWLLIDAATATLSVMRGDTVIRQFDDVAFGRLGTKPVHYQGDTSTPLGEFRIDGINNRSHYTLFFSLNYPTHRHAKLAMDQGKLSLEQYLAIFNNEMEGRKPPYDTPLGGMIGIHGLGAAPLAMHHKYNWTRGCIALDNQQILALAAYVRVGMRVVIR